MILILNYKHVLLLSKHAESRLLRVYLFVAFFASSKVFPEIMSALRLIFLKNASKLKI